jgi:hypothetical protein
MSEERYFWERAHIEQGHVKYRDKLKDEGKLFVRDRLKLLLDPGSPFQEDFLFARSQEADTPADGVVTGVGTVGGRTTVRTYRRLRRSTTRRTAAMTDVDLRAKIHELMTLGALPRSSALAIAETVRARNSRPQDPSVVDDVNAKATSFQTLREIAGTVHTTRIRLPVMFHSIGGAR